LPPAVVGLARRLPCSGPCSTMPHALNANASSTTSVSAPAPSANAAVPIGRPRVLLVDDEAHILRAFTRVLTQAGYDVVVAPDGADALHSLDAGAFDVVLSDISMPRLGGLALLRAVRQRDLDLPVILMTGTPNMESAREAIRFGVLDYLCKPLATADMISAVARGVQMYRLARIKREALQYLNGSTGSWIGDRAGLEMHFASALETLWMAYQPIVSWSRREIFAFEALVRTTTPALPNPGALLEAAERLGRLPQLGRRLRDEVARSADGEGSPQLFVNLHPTDLTDEALLSPGAALSQIASRVVLEITERDSLEEIPDVAGQVERLRALGFRIAIDDLGAGYSGLTSFAQLEPEVVKIDMSLIRDVDREPTKQRLVRSIVDLCQGMDIRVVCEGVETEAERDTLVGAGCDLFQGYHFARPGKAFPTVQF
jgi:EAL domain-containing protein (putative c-di-GMP-specific phosphodiesterase class I)/ActR/RegA family two-component response regulator